MLKFSRTALLAFRDASCWRPTTDPSRSFTAATAVAKGLQLPPRPKVNDDDIEEKFLKGSGPGGQKINKTNSAVQLRHIPTGTVVKCQATRSRIQNRKIARQLLADKLEEEEMGEESRTRLKEKDKQKKKASAAKKSRRKYRALEGEKQQVAEPSEHGSLEGETSTSGSSDAADISKEAADSRTAVDESKDSRP